MRTSKTFNAFMTTVSDLSTRVDSAIITLEERDTPLVSVPVTISLYNGEFFVAATNNDEVIYTTDLHEAVKWADRFPRPGAVAILMPDLRVPGDYQRQEIHLRAARAGEF